MSGFAHVPVMLNEVLDALQPADGETYVDGTLGGAGYARAVLQRADCHVIGIDRDPAAVLHAQSLHPKLEVVSGCFGDVRSLVHRQVDGFVLDLGVSSVQIDTPERGFSFRFDGPLDMRMDTASDGETAADIVNTYKQDDLANLIYIYGEERKSRRIAAAIIERRKTGRIETTFQLADVVRSVVPRSPKDQIDPSTRTFQALRIAVNDELGELKRALEASVYILKPGGRLVVVSFHSLEDGLVKSFLRTQSGGDAQNSRYAPLAANHNKPVLFTLPHKRALVAGPKETSENPRARSAKLRVGVRTSDSLTGDMTWN